MSRPVLVLLHGNWAGRWVWDPVLPALRARGFDAVAVDLPAHTDPESESSVAGHVARVRAAVGDRPGPIHLVGHSGGGLTVTAAGEALAERVAGVVYVAGIMVPSGVGFDALRAELDLPEEDLGVGPYLEPALGGAGTVVPADAAVALLFQRAPAASAVAAARRLAPQWSVGLDLAPEFTRERFGRLRRLYVEAAEDRDLPLGLQRHMQRRTPGAEVVTLDCDHAPQLSAPTELVDVLAAFVGG